MYEVFGRFIIMSTSHPLFKVSVSYQLNAITHHFNTDFKKIIGVKSQAVFRPLKHEAKTFIASQDLTIALRLRNC